MSKEEAQPTPQQLTKVVEAFLAEPPEGVPEMILDMLASCGDMRTSGLSPELYYKAVEQSAVAISITDTAANILYANSAFSRITGYAPKEVIGHNQSFLSDKSTPKIVYEAMWARLSQQKSWSGMLVNRRKDGSRYVADLVIVPVQNADGVVTHYLGMHRDVTEMNRLEQEVRNQKALIETVLDAMPMAIAVLDRNGRIVLDNQEYKKLLGDLRVGEPARFFLQALGYDVSGGIAGAAEGFNAREVRFDPRGGNAPRWFSCTGIRFREAAFSAESFFDNAREDHLLLVASETTRAKQQEEELRVNALRALMAEGERTQGIREALSGAMYQLQAPFNLISAAVGIMSRREGPAAKERHLYQVLDEAIKSGRKAMETLRGCMPNDTEEVSGSVNLNQLIRDLLSVNTRRMLGMGVVVDWQPDPELPKVTANEGALRRLFKQLLDNAMDAMDASDIAMRELTLYTRTFDTYCEIGISDTGPGISEEDRIKVFQPFYSTKQQQGCAGMGLTMAQEIANEHAGTIIIDPAEETGGCRIRVHLPLAQAPLGGLS
jgi:nitrogen fixation negative regulator NifL